jgi:hypothetical protein
MLANTATPADRMVRVPFNSLVSALSLFVLLALAVTILPALLETL